MAIEDDPNFSAWVQRVREDLLPKLGESAYVMSLVPEGDSDVKFAVETGFAIMMDKPIILIVKPGQFIPEKLVRVADAIVEADISTDAGRTLMTQRLIEAMTALKARGIG